MEKLFLLKQIGFGVIAYNENKQELINEYNEKTENGKYAGFSVYEIDRPEISKMNQLNVWEILNHLCNEDGKKIL